MSDNQSPDYVNVTVKQFLTEAAAAQETPGGGSVSALVGALATTMAQMALNYTVGKEKYADVDEPMRNHLAEMARCQASFERLIPADIEAFRNLMASYRLPKGTQDKAARIAAATDRAIAVPSEMVDTALAVLESVNEFSRRCNQNLVSDAAVAAVLAEATARAAALNVRINLPSVMDDDKRERIKQALGAKLARAKAYLQNVEDYMDAYFDTMCPV